MGGEAWIDTLQDWLGCEVGPQNGAEPHIGTRSNAARRSPPHPNIDEVFSYGSVCPPPPPEPGHRCSFASSEILALAAKKPEQHGVFSAQEFQREL